MGRYSVLIAVVAVALAGMGPASAQDSAGAVKARQAGMKAVGAAVKGLNDKLVAKAEMRDLRPYAARLNQLVLESRGWFPAGSGPASGVKTKAKPEIWSNAPAFQKAQAAFVAQSAKVTAASKGSDLDALKTEFMALRRMCKSCHDAFTTD